MAIKFEKSSEKLKLEFNTKNLSPAQIRLVKSINAALAHVLASDTEAEFFDGSAELMRLTASLIQQADFQTKDGNASIPYAEQVLEFSVDALQEQISMSKVVTYDN